MKERCENSVLTSLKDLRSIEEDRLKLEDEARQAQAERERREREAAIQRAKEEEARRIEAQAESERAARDALRREEREAAVRLAQAEATARVEAEARLEAERMRLTHADAPKGSHRPIAVAVALLGLLVVLGGGSAYVFGVYMPEKEREREATGRARLREVEARAEADRKALLSRLSEQEKRIQGAIANADSAAEVNRLQQQLDALKKEKAAAASPRSTPRGRDVRGGRPRPAMDAPAMKPDPEVKNSALRGLFGDN